MIDNSFENAGEVVVKVFGVGGAGGNVVTRLIENGVHGVQFVSLNTDLQALKANKADVKILLGRKLTKGQGAGNLPDTGLAAAMEAEDQIRDQLRGCDMAIIIAGMGGGTGTFSAAYIAELARQEGCLTLAFAITPLANEGPFRNANSLEGIKRLKQHAHSVIDISNEKLMQIASPSTTVIEGFKTIDNVVRQGVQGIAEIITYGSLVNVDFADIRTVLSQKGDALLGIGGDNSPDRAILATRKAISFPLLETSIARAENAIVHISSNASLTLLEKNQILEEIKRAAGPNINIIDGYALSDVVDDYIYVTIIALGTDLSIRENPTSKLADKFAAAGGDDNSFSSGKDPAKENKPKANVPSWLKHKK